MHNPKTSYCLKAKQLRSPDIVDLQSCCVSCLAKLVISIDGFHECKPLITPGCGGLQGSIIMDPSCICNSLALRENTMHFCQIFFFCFSLCCSVNCMRRKSNIAVLSRGMMTHWICWIVKAHLIKSQAKAGSCGSVGCLVPNHGLCN